MPSLWEWMAETGGELLRGTTARGTRQLSEFAEQQGAERLHLLSFHENEHRVHGLGCILALKEAGRVRLVSRNERDHTKRCSKIVAALTALKPHTFTLDGEVAVFDAELVSRFEWLRHINHGDLATPRLFMVFDLLQLVETDYRKEPLKTRRKALEKLVKRQKLILPAHRLAPNGFAAWAEALHRGYEGMVAKDPESPYVGGRTLKWLKVKQPHYREGERGWERKKS